MHRDQAPEDSAACRLAEDRGPGRNSLPPPGSDGASSTEPVASACPLPVCFPVVPGTSQPRIRVGTKTLQRQLGPPAQSCPLALCLERERPRSGPEAQLREPRRPRLSAPCPRPPSAELMFTAPLGVSTASRFDGTRAELLHYFVKLLNVIEWYILTRPRPQGAGPGASSQGRGPSRSALRPAQASRAAPVQANATGSTCPQTADGGQLSAKRRRRPPNPEQGDRSAS